MVEMVVWPRTTEQATVADFSMCDVTSRREGAHLMFTTDGIEIARTMCAKIYIYTYMYIMGHDVMP